jgi:hypothetical protein
VIAKNTYSTVREFGILLKEDIIINDFKSLSGLIQSQEVRAVALYVPQSAIVLLIPAKYSHQYYAYINAPLEGYHYLYYVAQSVNNIATQHNIIYAIKKQIETLVISDELRPWLSAVMLGNMNI